MVVLQVEGMSCSHCASMVTKAVRDVDTSAKVDVDLAGKKVTIESSADLGEISTAISEAGYPVAGSTKN